MSKAVVSNRIYLKNPSNGFKHIQDALTYKLEIKSNKGNKKQIQFVRNYKMIAKDIISIPQGRLDLIPDDCEIVDKRVYNEEIFNDPLIQLRPDQQEIVDQIDDSCFLNALPGWGKTFTALHIAYKLGQKTLIIAHTAMLRDQWIKEVQHLFGEEPGVIGSGKFDISGPIVIGNVQTVTKHSLTLSKVFGTVIMDEGHHCPAETFSSLIDSMHSRYRIGLSGTMIRGDGKHVMLPDFFGHTVLKPEQANTLDPTVRIIKCGQALPPGDNWAARINNLLYDVDYQQYIATIAATLMGKGYSVLIPANRIEFLTNIKEILGEKCVLVTGESADAEEREAIKERINKGEITCVTASTRIFAEGISVNALSAIILAEPMVSESLLEQLISRIIRIHPGKRNPLVVDINFSSYSDRKQNAARLALYLKKGWEIEGI